MNVYIRGNLVRERNFFTNRDLTAAEEATFNQDGTLPVGVGVDPTTVVAKVKKPDGTSTPYTYPSSPEVVKVVAGSYYVQVDANVNGQWWVRWESTGTGQAADETPFFVKSEVV